MSILGGQVLLLPLSLRKALPLRFQIPYLKLGLWAFIFQGGGEGKSDVRNHPA